ncbi:amino acid adenylation domain-containing protein [Lentzea sp. NEAU-D13]|uniref:Amino acid adenylation domain-containing protein n=1 Tax=Lentzea alba TaxID=2714351 RepID=A0A7C9RTJ5_9PSEU|nr:non-ribosomal peptide synthetase [Lentzea alba]NGY62590.1 amino acid adenylation domain-containing protein [Lentzea alba]
MLLTSVRTAPTFVDVLTDRAAGSSRVALRFDDGAGQSALTYSQLHDRARSVAALLAQRCAPGDRVLLQLPPSLDYVVAFLGCLYAGVIAVPLYPSGTGRHVARHRALVADAAPAAVIARGEVSDVDVPVLSVDGDLPAPGEWRRPPITPDTVAFLQYTSGSTATPRGVVVSHRNLLANSLQIGERFGATEDTRAVSWLPPYHDMGLIGGILQPIHAGATATLFAPVSFISNPLRWLRLISEQRATVSGGPNFAYDLCADRLTDADLAGLDLSSWEIAFNGAEPVRAATLERFAERMAPYGFRREAFLPCYGLAEATLMVSGHRAAPVTTFAASSLVPGEHVVPDPAGRPIVSCGPVVDGVTTVVVNTETGTACQDGAVGEIWVAGENVASGYWGREDDDVFGASLPGDDRAWLRTGDLGFVFDGLLHVTGRAKDLIVVRGRNHYPQDLERCALDAHPALRRGAAAFGLGEREEVCLVLESATAHRAEENAEIVVAVCAAMAREHGVTPATIVFVRPGKIPTTSSGKVQRSRTREMFADGSLQPVHRWDAAGAGDLAAVSEEDRADTAREVVLRLAAARLGRPADPAVPLVAQGLDSLSATELSAAITDALGVRIEPRTLLDGATIDSLPLDAPAGRTASVTPVAAGPQPMTANQKALWLLEQLNPGTATQHVYAAIRFESEVDAEALRRAFQSLVDRHPALRTAVRGSDEPRQEVLAHQEVAFTVEDAAALDEDAFAARLERETTGEFALAEGRVLRAVLFRRPGGDVLALVVHHIAVDMWSIAVLAEELGQLYSGAPLPPAPAAGPVEVARRQHELLASPRGAELREHWRSVLDGVEPVLELPADRPRPATRGHRGHSVTTRLDRELTTALRGLAAEHDTTLFVVLLSVFQALVHRYTGERDFLVGVPAAGRTDPDFHRVVGYFVNPVPVRARIDEARTAAEHVRSAGKAVGAALAHQDMPFPQLVEELELAREASRAPGFQVMFSQTRSHLPDSTLGVLTSGRAGVPVRLGELRGESVELTRHTAEVDLTMVVAEDGDEIEVVLNYSTDLFDRGTIDRFGANYALLAAEVARDATRPLGEITPVSEQELRLIAGWNATATPYPRTKSVVDLFADQVAARPDAPALTYGALSYSYRELDQVSTALARRLRSLGVGAGTPVGLCTDRDPTVIVAMLAVAKAGGAYVPLDPAHPPHRLRQIVAESAPALLLATGKSTVDADLPVVEVRDFLTPSATDDIDWDRPVADSLLYVMYTSGSSGTPKGICIAHRNVVRLVRDTNYMTIAPGDRVAQISNAAFDAATLEVWGSLLNGGHLVGFDKDTVLSPPALAEALRSGGIHTVVFATPLFTQVAAYDAGTFAAAKQLLVGGDTMDPKIARAVSELGGPLLSNGYGPTESATFATVQALPEVGQDVARLPIGGPISNTQVHILDPLMRPVPIGVPGELHIGGDGLGHGYLNRAGLTADRFRPDPFSGVPGSRLYATGDKARWLPDGSVDFLGRLDFQVKIRGFRIELGDVEAALVEHPGVVEAVVVADDSVGEKRLAAYYAGSPDPAELSAHLAARLPEYMVPAVLVRLPELPKNPNRKLDRAALPRPSEAVVAPAAGDTTAEICALFAELLGRAEVLPDDNFFEIGGHSLVAIKLLTRIRDTYGVELPLNDLFTDPTARAVAKCIDQATTPEPDTSSQICALFAELLGRPEVQPDDNFFEIGGHSLVAIKLLTRIRDTYGVELPLNDLFTDPTARAVAKCIDQATTPEPDTSSQICALFAELLGRPEVQPDDNFFEIGGHSLVAIKLLTRIRDTYGVELPLNDLFTDPTARAVAKCIDQASTPAPTVPAGPAAVPRDAYARPASR